MSSSPGPGESPKTSNQRGYTLLAVAAVLIVLSWLTVKANRPVSDALAIAAAAALIAGIVGCYWHLVPRKAKAPEDDTR